MTFCQDFVLEIMLSLVTLRRCSIEFSFLTEKRRREDANTISKYQMMIHLLGKNDSPCCANWALKRCKTDKENIHVTEAFKQHFYMDDYLGAFSSLKDAYEISRSLYQHTLQNNFRHGFLTQFFTNS